MTFQEHTGFLSRPMKNQVWSMLRRRIPRWWGFNLSTLVLVVAAPITAVVLLWPISRNLLPDEFSFAGSHPWQINRSIHGNTLYVLGCPRGTFDEWTPSATIREADWFSDYPIERDWDRKRAEADPIYLDFYPSSNISVSILFKLPRRDFAPLVGKEPNSELMEFGDALNRRLEEPGVLPVQWRPLGWVLFEENILPKLRQSLNAFLIWLA